MNRRCFAGGLLCLAVLILSCNRKQEAPPPTDEAKKEPPPPPGFGPPKPFVEEVEPHAAGKKVYNKSGCMRCHMMEGLPGMPVGPGAPPPLPGKGPLLAKVASKPERDVDWFIAYVSNPRKVKPESEMPPFEKKISAEELRSLAEFLASLK
jgi:mono/diheme cytochrome c family protein